jgi:site-specific recombinase XerD
LLLPRPHTKEALVRQLRDYFHQVCHSLGLPVRIVPHQLRHTYATEMLRSGVTLVQNRFLESEIRGVPSYN